MITEMITEIWNWLLYTKVDITWFIVPGLIILMIKLWYEIAKNFEKAREIRDQIYKLEE